MKDFDKNNPKLRWEKRFSNRELQNLFPNIGGIKNIEILNLTNTGRVKNVRISGDYSSKKISGVDFRRKMNLNSNFFRLNSTFKSIFFIFNSFVFLSTIDYNILSVDNLGAREIPVLLTLMLLIHTLQSKSFNYSIILIISFLSITSLFWGVDRGLVVNFIILCLLLKKF